MFVYSAIKIRANWPPLYSVLKPDTSSLSPSAWSKGARLVSARQAMNQIKVRGGASKARGGVSTKVLWRSKDFRDRRNTKSVMVRVTS